MTKVPFIYTECKENSNGFDINFISKEVHGDSTGVDITGIAKVVRGNSRGVDITVVMKFVDGDSKGVDITGIEKVVSGNSKGVSLTGLFNYSGGVEDFLIQYGTLVNYIKEKDDDSFGLQIGLYNRIGDQTRPLINFWGLKNILGYFQIKAAEKRLEKLKEKKRAPKKEFSILGN